MIIVKNEKNIWSEKENGHRIRRRSMYTNVKHWNITEIFFKK